MEIKNYRVNFIDGEHIYITAAQAARLFTSIENTKFFLDGGNVYAVHQIKNIKKISTEEYRTKYSENGEYIPSITDYIASLTPEVQKKKLN